MHPSPPENTIYAAVELGSDGFRLHIGRFDDGVLHLVASLAEPVALAASLDADGMLCAAAIRRALDCLGRFRGALDAWQPRGVRVVATAALRMARNAALFLPAAAQALGRPIEVIAGDEAGRLVYLGVATTLGELDTMPRLVVDIGSASTELVVGEGKAIRRIESFAVGAVRQSLTFFADGRLDAAGFDAAVRSSRNRFAESGLAARGWPLAYGACGTVRALADIAGLEGAPLTPALLACLRERFIETGQAPGHLAGGLALLIGLMEELEIDALAPVHAGLRVGALWDLHRRDGMLQGA